MHKYLYPCLHVPYSLKTGARLAVRKPQPLPLASSLTALKIQVHMQPCCLLTCVLGIQEAPHACAASTGIHWACSLAHACPNTILFLPWCMPAELTPLAPQQEPWARRSGHDWTAFPRSLVLILAFKSSCKLNQIRSAEACCIPNVNSRGHTFRTDTPGDRVTTELDTS